MERGHYHDDYAVVSQFSLGMGVSRNGCIVLLHAVFCVVHLLARVCKCARIFSSIGWRAGNIVIVMYLCRSVAFDRARV